MRYIKKISETPVRDGGLVVDSFATTNNKETNAPSLGLVSSTYDNNLIASADFRYFALNNAESYCGWKLDYGAWTPNGLFISADNGGKAVAYSIGVIAPSFKVTKEKYTITVECGIGGNPTDENVKRYTATVQTNESVTFTTDEGNSFAISIGGGTVLITSKVFVSPYAIRRIKIERGTVATPFVENPRDFSLLQAAYRSSLQSYTVEEWLDFENGVTPSKSFYLSPYFTDVNSISVIINGIATLNGMTASITKASLSEFTIVVQSTDKLTATQKARITFIGH